MSNSPEDIWKGTPRPPVGTKFMHLRSNKNYEIVGYCLRVNDLVLCALYKRSDLENPPVWCRPFWQFNEGRFKQVG